MSDDKNKNIKISQTDDAKPKEKIIMQSAETNINKKDNQKMKGLIKQSAKEKCNTDMENIKKATLDRILSKNDKAKIDNSKKK